MTPCVKKKKKEEKNFRVHRTHSEVLIILKLKNLRGACEKILNLPVKKSYYSGVSQANIHTFFFILLFGIILRMGGS